jgi:hypothetical protein
MTNKRALSEIAGQKVLVNTIHKKNLLKEKIKPLKEINIEHWAELTVKIVNMGYRDVRKVLVNINLGMNVIEAVEAVKP